MISGAFPDAKEAFKPGFSQISMAKIQVGPGI
jgi:hypothetical protein